MGWLTEPCTSMQNSIFTARDHHALIRPRLPYTYRHCKQIVCIFLPAMQTSSRKPILNWYPECFPGPPRGHSHCRRLSTYRCLPPRNASRRLRRTKATTGPSAICFLPTPTTAGRLTASPVWKQFQDEKPLRPQESTLYIPRFFSLTWDRSLKPEAKTKSRNLIGSQTDVKIFSRSERTNVFTKL